MSSTPFLLLVSIVSIHLVAAISPGPAFLLVTRAALAQSRYAGIATGWGVATAALLWAIAASLGMGVLLAHLPMLNRAIQLAGGGYLVWIGIKSWRHATDPMVLSDAASVPRVGLWQSYFLGFKSSLTNPKMIVFFGSIFVTLFSDGTPIWVRVAALTMVPINEGCWYSLVSCLFSTARVRNAYRAAKSSVDRVVGTFLGGFGARLVAGAMTQVGQ